MSVEALAVVLHHSAAAGTPKVVLLGIANHDGDGGAHPAVKTLAKYANVDERSVQRALGVLVDLGEVRVVKRWTYDASGTKRTLTNQYEILVRCPTECDRSFQHRLVSAGQQQQTTPTSPPGDAHVTPPGDAHVTRGVTPTSPKPSLNQPSKPQTSSRSVTATSRATRGTRIPEQFDLTDDLKTWARDKAPHAGPDDHDAFIDYWRSVPGSRGLKADWPATWRSWMRKASGERVGAGTGPNTRPRQSTTERNLEQTASALAVAKARRASREQPNGSSHQLQIGGNS